MRVVSYLRHALVLRQHVLKSSLLPAILRAESGRLAFSYLFIFYCPWPKLSPVVTGEQRSC